MQAEFGKKTGGRLSLDFVNTVSGRAGNGTIGERLDSYDALVRWSRFIELLTSPEASSLAKRARARPDEAAAVVRRALAMREAIYHLMKTAIDRRRPRAGDLEVVNAELLVARSHERLSTFALRATEDEVASRRFTSTWSDPRSLDRVLWPVARSAADLLTSSELERVRQCPGEECGWLFLDTSRSGRRQWCDMAECGNLAKVRRFRQRARTGRG